MVNSTIKRRQLWKLGIRHCRYCEREMTEPVHNLKSGPLTATLDHWEPKSKGGLTGNGNGVLACRDCNELKGDLLEADFAAVIAWFESTGRNIIRVEKGHLKPLVNMPGVVDYLRVSSQERAERRAAILTDMIATDQEHGLI